MMILRTILLVCITTHTHGSDENSRKSTSPRRKRPSISEAFSEARLATNLSATTIADPRVHDWIELTDVEKKIVDTPAMQRLRRIQQLSGVSMVWPSANHDRFVHSLGVMHLAKKLVKSIRDKQPDLITDREAELVAIAGLMHDVGHGPWSHMWDQITEEKHEKRSCEIVKKILPSIGYSPSDITFVQSLIKPKLYGTPTIPVDPEVTKLREEKGFLYEIVANEHAQLDVDKMDYLMRDAEATGMGINLKHAGCRLIQGARVATGPDGKQHIAYPQKTQCSVSEIFQCRYKMHAQVYKHRAVVAAETMIHEAIVLAFPSLGLLERSRDVNGEYLYLTDNVLEEIKSEARKLASPRTPQQVLADHDYAGVLSPPQADLLNACVLLERIDCRDIYKSVLDERLPELSEDDKNSFKDQLCQSLPWCSADDILIKVNSNGLGGKIKDPLECVMFYTSDDKDNCTGGVRTQVSCVEALYKGRIDEVVVQAYVTKSELAKNPAFMKLARQTAKSLLREATDVIMSQ